MRKDVKLGSKTVPMLANATTVIRYRQVFKRDLLIIMNKQEEESDYTGELGFIMAKQAEGAEMGRLSYEDYVAWTSQFDAMDLFGSQVANEILLLFLAQQKPEIEEKKKDAEPNGK